MTPVVFLVTVPDPFDQLSNMTINTYGVCDNNSENDGTAPWKEFKKNNGKAAGSWRRS